MERFSGLGQNPGGEQRQNRSDRKQYRRETVPENAFHGRGKVWKEFMSSCPGRRNNESEISCKYSMVLLCQFSFQVVNAQATFVESRVCDDLAV